MNRFTIAIPTYNRSAFLRRAIQAALDQTQADIEVLVSDNASTDDTPEVVRSFGNRVRYHRNETNIGSWPNFVRLTELATGDYFSWLQDDDLIHRDFVRRAVEALDFDPQIRMYAAYVVDSPSYDTFVLPPLYGPPVAVNWMRSSNRVIPGDGVVPLSLFTTFAVPPVTAYRTEVLRVAARFARPDCVLFNERIVQTHAVVGGQVCVDAWAAGIFFKHDAQDSRLSGSLDGRRTTNWFVMADELEQLLSTRPPLAWQPFFAEWLDSLADADRELILFRYLPPQCALTRLGPTTRGLLDQFLSHVPVEVVQEWQRTSADPKRLKTRVKWLLQQSTPPAVWRMGGKLRSALRRRMR